MVRSALRFVLAVCVIVVVALLVRDDTRAYLKDVFLNSGTFAKIHDINLSLSDLKEDVKNIVDQMPEPLVSKLRQKEGYLDAAKVVAQTNIERSSNGLDSLQINTKLTSAAEAKVDDMFKFQYFEHDSPQGKSPSTFVKGAGYEYLTIGENLALGIFEDEKDLVTAWMNSPGHRANILGKHFTEIGVAVKRGVYQGDTVWMAVQEFGRPLDLCPKPDVALKAQIERDSQAVIEFSKAMTTLRQKIEDTPKKDPEYNTSVAAYNDLVNQYNALIKALAARGELYNKAAAQFNLCVKEGTS